MRSPHALVLKSAVLALSQLCDRFSHQSSHLYQSHPNQPLDNLLHLENYWILE